MTVEIRKARAEDAASIAALVRSERLNPTGLVWTRFHVADEGGAIVGAVQLRPAGPQLGSLVVRPDRRGAGLARRLIAAALEGADGPVYLVCPASLADLYRAHGFERVGVRAAPVVIGLHRSIGQCGALLALARCRRPRRLIAMARPAPARVA